jgi:hypothetical protein
MAILRMSRQTRAGLFRAILFGGVRSLDSIIVPRSPQPKTSPGYFARASGNRSHGRSVQLCDVGTKRVAPFSTRNESTMRMNPSNGTSSEPRAKPACSFFRSRQRAVARWQDHAAYRDAARDEFSTLLHEIGHEMLHRGERCTLTTKTVRETEAEAVSFVVCQAIGLENGSPAADYIQIWNVAFHRASGNLVPRPIPTTSMRSVNSFLCHCDQGARLQKPRAAIDLPGSWGPYQLHVSFKFSNFSPSYCRP